MKIETAIERLQEMIGYNEDYWAFLASTGHGHEDLHDTELELEALRMAVQALKSSPRWIPCSERLPEMHEEEFDGELFRASDKILFSSATGVHCGCCEDSEGGPMWYTEEGLFCENIIAWTPLPEVYSKE